MVTLMTLDMVPTKSTSEKFTSLFKDYDLSLFGKRFSTVHGYLIIQTTCNMLNLVPKNTKQKLSRYKPLDLSKYVKTLFKYVKTLFSHQRHWKNDISYKIYYPKADT